MLLLLPDIDAFCVSTCVPVIAVLVVVLFVPSLLCRIGGIGGGGRGGGGGGRGIGGGSHLVSPEALCA